MEHTSPPEVAHPADTEPLLRTLPPTVLLWLFLIVLALGVPRLLSIGSAARTAASQASAPLSVREFQDFVQAETLMRSGFASRALLSSLPGGSLPLSRSEQNGDFFRKAISSFRTLARESHSIRAARRVLIIEHAQGKPLDEPFLASVLADNLRQSKKSSSEIESELQLWRSMYSTKPPQALTDTATGEKLLRGMSLGFLEEKALADLERAADRGTAAAQREEAFHQRARRHAVVQFLMVGYLIVAFLTGVFVLLWASIRAANRKLIVTTATEPHLPHRLGWGDLIDVFFFYLALYLVTGRLVGVVSEQLLPPDQLARVALAQGAAVTVGSALAATWYLYRKARLRGTTLADIGWRAPRGVFPEMGWGVLGFCATLPLTILLRKLSELIYRDSGDLTPNPALPLLLTENSLVGRLILFGLVAISAPLFEELFFRGALFSGLRARMSWLPAALLSATVFALLHPMNDWLPIIGLGFVFALLREGRQSLVPSITAHFLQNTQSYLALLFTAGS